MDWDSERKDEKFVYAMIIFMLVSPVALIGGAIFSPGWWLMIPGLGTAVFIGFVVMVRLLGGAEKDKGSGRRRGRRTKPLTWPNPLPADMVLDPYATDVASLWAGEEAPDDFTDGHFENRLDGLLAARRAADSEPTRFTAFEHVGTDGTRRWYLLVPLRGGQLPPLTVRREPGKQDHPGDIDTGDSRFDALYAVRSWDQGPAAEAYARELLTPQIISQMKEVAFEWRIRGRHLIANPDPADARALIAFAQNQGTQLALVADQIPRELFARYAGWYAERDRLANPDELR